MIWVSDLELNDFHRLTLIENLNVVIMVACDIQSYHISCTGFHSLINYAFRSVILYLMSFF